MTEVDLFGWDVLLSSSNDRKTLSVLKKAGGGKKGTTWQVCDSYGQIYALKVTPKSAYSSYSVHAEMSRISRLPPAFGRIFGYGELSSTSDAAKELEECYGILEEWVEGMTLAEFISNGELDLDVAQFRRLIFMICEGVAALRKQNLCHNDLHGENIMVSEASAGPHQTPHKIVRFIDCGSMTSLQKKQELLDKWTKEIQALGSITGSDSLSRQEEIKSWIGWFSREDSDYLASHICSLANMLLSNPHRLTVNDRKFVDSLDGVLSRMTDHDKSRKLDDPGEVYSHIDSQWKKIASPDEPQMLTPFDYISAELIRSDLQLNDLFSEKCPWFEACATTDPIYLYGPRGCGKSTILRMLSLRSVLSRRDAAQCFERQPFIGVYLSCSSELRSRFWLFRENFFDSIRGDAILFFTLLLVEALVDSLQLLEDDAAQSRLGRSVGLTPDTSYQICRLVLARLGIETGNAKLQGISWLDFLRKQVILYRSLVWKRIIEEPKNSTPDAAIIFDICKDLEGVFPLLAKKHIAFLIDDYSNQRIPVPLQRMLNQTISFSKHGNPIFKVSSEFRGLDLEGIQEGREVSEVNLGREYVELSDPERTAFLQDVFDKRFALAGSELRVDALLGKSGVSPGLPMARAIKEQFANKGDNFYYHGIDTISDICSGDIAMAIDLVKQIYVQAKSNGKPAGPVSPSIQHDIIRRASEREHLYLRYFSNHGQQISRVVDALCRLAHDATVMLVSKKDGREEPMIKSHLDISDLAASRLDKKNREMLEEMERKGVFFCLDTSRSRITNAGTERFQVRRILLVKHVAPLGRRDPIKLDHEQKLVFLLTEPEEFVKQELIAGGGPDKAKRKIEDRGQDLFSQTDANN